MVDKVLRFAAGCSVADGDSFDLVGFDHLTEFRSGFTGLADRRMRINVFIMQQITLSVETNNLATGTETGIDGEYPLLSQWGGKE